MPGDYTKEVEALFTAFAERHGLKYDVETGARMEVCWTFPEQEKLSQSLTLGLLNGVEFEFGVSDFRSYFFPFESVAEDFVGILDAWVTGQARVAIAGRSNRLLQVHQGGEWRTVSGANGCLFPIRARAREFVMNERGPASLPRS